VVTNVLALVVALQQGAIAALCAAWVTKSDGVSNATAASKACVAFAGAVTLAILLMNSIGLL
jgi:hypothetical protein